MCNYCWGGDDEGDGDIIALLILFIIAVITLKYFW